MYKGNPVMNFWIKCLKILAFTQKSLLNEPVK